MTRTRVSTMLFPILYKKPNITQINIGRKRPAYNCHSNLLNPTMVC